MHEALVSTLIGLLEIAFRSRNRSLEDSMPHHRRRIPLSAE